jgi:methylenetetrahydrofolate reductase (NADPH)
MKKNCMPVFMDVTWGAGGSTSELTMDLVRFIKSEGCVANMHLTCTNMDPLKVKEALSDARKYGITNIVALRGDAPNGDDEWKAAEGGFKCALDLVKFIRKEFGNEVSVCPAARERQRIYCKHSFMPLPPPPLYRQFGISVAGYPEGHPNAISVIEEGGTKEVRLDVRQQ